MTIFKPLNLLKFHKDGNVHTFLKLFDNSINGASDAKKETIAINFLDTTFIALVMPHLSSDCWSYFEACEAIIAEFGSEAFIASKKDTFMHIEFKDNKNIEEFADRFYLEAQILMVCGALTTFDAKIALKYAIK